MKGRVTGHYVAVKPKEIETVSDGGIVLATEFNSDLKSRESAGTTRGTVIDVGPDAWVAHDSVKPWAKVGDEVSFVRHASKIIEDDHDMDDKGKPRPIFVMVDENIIWNHTEG